MIINEIIDKSSEIKKIIRNNNGSSVKVFGSVANETSDDDSDIDFLVKFSKNASLFDLIEIKMELEELLNNKVDVVSENGLKDNDIGRAIRRSAISI